VGSGAKNHHFHRGPRTDREVEPNRRAKIDRRDAARAGQYSGVERRVGPRRAAELPVPIWQRVVGMSVAVALGVIVGLAVDLHEDAPPPSIATQAPAEEVVDPEALALVEALHDEARALTVAEVALDERAHERWLPRVAEIEAALEDPATPEPIRAELLATIAALECVGVLAGDPDRTCATISR
jgi:hypothetical protein